MAKAIRAISTVGTLPQPYGTSEMSAEVDGLNNGGRVKLEALSAEESMCMVPCVRVTPVGGGVNKKILEIPMTAILSIEPKHADKAQNVTIRRITRDE